MTEKQIIRAIKKYKKLLKLEDWSIRIMHEPHLPQKHIPFVTMITADIDLPFKMARITFNDKYIDKLKPEQILHEMLHLILEPLYQFEKYLPSEQKFWFAYFNESITEQLKEILK